MSGPSTRFPIIAYLNQGVVFDLIAMLEDGIANIAAVKTTENSQSSSSGALDAKLGVSNVFSLFGINLSARGDRSKSKSGTTERSEERVYTPNSLFDKLRRAMYEQEAVIDLDATTDFDAGSFVEFTATLRKNPFLDAMEQLSALGEFISDFEKPNRPVSNKGQHAKVVGANSSTDFQRTMHMVSVLREMFERSPTNDVLADSSQADRAIVITLDRKFVDTAVFNTLIDGEFKIFGKVLRTFDPTESLDLMRNSPIRVMPKEVLADLTNSLNAVNRQIQFNLPEIQTVVAGPALLISPIAIFT
jgi:hypothetical protein